MENFIDYFSTYSMYQLLWFFVIYSVAGWCLEVAYHVVTVGKFINRGFLNGPVCPVYGFGMLIVILCLEPVKSNPLLLFFGSVILTTLLELVTGFVLLKIFHERWWDYSSEPFNLNGYICLKFSFMWGLGGMFAVDIIHEIVYRTVRIFPHTIGIILLASCLAIFACDAVITVITIMKLNKRLKTMNELGLRIRKLSDTMGEGIYDVTVHGMEKSEEVRIGIDEKKERFARAKKIAEFNLAEKRDAAAESIGNKIDSFGETVTDKMDILGESVSDRMDNFGEAVTDKMENSLRNAETELKELREKLSALTSTHKFGQRRILKAFPNVKNTDYSAEIASLKKLAQQKKCKKSENTEKTVKQ